MDALAGVRVVDFTWYGAGPYCTLMMALMGAEVIKIESMKRLDNARIRGEAFQKTGNVDQSQAFNSGNLNKLSLTLNLTKPKAIELAKAITLTSDVVANNFSAGVMDRLGLGYDVLRKIRPDIVMLSSSASGSTGPESRYVGFASVFGALSGLGWMTGYTDGPPVEMRLPMDYGSATMSLFAVLAALNCRKRTGVGQHIDLASREVPSCFIGDSLMAYIMNGRNQARSGNQDDTMAPHNCYPCKGEDAWVSIAVPNEEEWAALCNAMDNPAWTKEECFSDALSRWRNQVELDKLIGQWTVNHTHYEVMHILQAAGVAAFPSMSGKDIFTDPHIADRGLAPVVEHPLIGKQTVVGIPFKLSATPGKVKRHAPLLGEHNSYVLGKLLGIAEREIKALAEEEVVY